MKDLSLSRGNDAGSSRWAKCNHKGPCKGEVEGPDSERRCDNRGRGQSGERCGNAMLLPLKMVNEAMSQGKPVASRS